MKIFAFYIVAFAAPVYAMELSEPSIVILKDNTNTVAITTDLKTVELMRSFSTTLKEKPLQRSQQGILVEYTIATGLPKSSLNLLLQIASNGIHPLRAISSGTIDLSEVTREQVNKLGLPKSWQDSLNNMLVIYTTTDNLLFPADKDIATYFFQTVQDISQEFPQQFIVDVGVVDRPTVVDLYNIVRPLERPSQTSLLYAPWKEFKQSIIKENETLTTAQLLPLLEAANFLGAPTYVLAALYELYKKQFLATTWIIQEAAHPFLVKVEEIINQPFPSIEWLLKKGLNNFYSIQESKGPGGTYKMMKIQGPSVVRLKGIERIPGIDTCHVVDISNTKITTIETSDLNALTFANLLLFRFNKLLTTLENNCFNLQNLKNLRLAGNNIAALSPGIFNLPALENLEFDSNHLQLIKANWDSNLLKLKKLTLNEPELQTLEPGWLKGLFSLQEVAIHKRINPTLITQIQNNLANHLLIGFAAAAPRLTYTTSI